MNKALEHLPDLSYIQHFICDFLVVSTPFNSQHMIFQLRIFKPFCKARNKVRSLFSIAINSYHIQFGSDRLVTALGQFTRNYTQTVKRAADNKRRYAPGWVHSTCLLRGFPKGAAPHLAHDFAEQSVVCYTLCRRCPENTVAAGEGKGI